MNLKKQDTTAADNDLKQKLDAENDGDMSPELFNAIIQRWQMSNQFLSKFLRRQIETIRSYKYGRLPIPQTIADKMRRLHIFMAFEK
jgi:hypothetical protein